MGSSAFNRLLLAPRTPWPIESLLFDESDHFPDGPVEADEDRSGNNAVSDVEFFNLPDFCYWADVFVMETMPGRYSEIAVGSFLHGNKDFIELSFSLGRVLCVTVMARVDLNGIRSRFL